MEPELQNYLSGINQNLVDLKNKKGPGVWRSFFNGMFSAFGYLAGLAFVIVVIGWVLNKTGTLGAFREEIRQFQAFFSQAQKLINVGGNSQEQGSGGETIITLPDGQKVKVSQ